jgi:hypothetical protein
MLEKKRQTSREPSLVQEVKVVSPAIVESQPEKHNKHVIHSIHILPELTSPPKTTYKAREKVLRMISSQDHTSIGFGRIHYTGRTANMHVHAQDELFGHALGDGAPENQWRIEMLLPELSSDTLDYLMGLYWTYHNSTVHLVHIIAFNEDRTSGKGEFYSTFLHFCMLSMGYRYSDKSRPDIQRIALPAYESTLHQKALKMVEYELKKPGGVPSVQALFLLGDLECGRGRDSTGWMYGGTYSELRDMIMCHSAILIQNNLIGADIYRNVISACNGYRLTP